MYWILTWLRESFGKHMSPLPRVYRSLCPHSLPRFPRYYRGRYPHPRGITTTVIPITAVNTAVLPQSPSPCQSLVGACAKDEWWQNSWTSATIDTGRKKTGSATCHLATCHQQRHWEGPPNPLVTGGCNVTDYKQRSPNVLVMGRTKVEGKDFYIKSEYLLGGKASGRGSKCGNRISSANVYTWVYLAQFLR